MQAFSYQILQTRNVRQYQCNQEISCRMALVSESSVVMTQASVFPLKAEQLLPHIEQLLQLNKLHLLHEYRQSHMTPL